MDCHQTGLKIQDTEHKIDVLVQKSLKLFYFFFLIVQQMYFKNDKEQESTITCEH